jgi:hypothetical protein
VSDESCVAGPFLFSDDILLQQSPVGCMLLSPINTSTAATSILDVGASPGVPCAHSLLEWPVLLAAFIYMPQQMG